MLSVIYNVFLTLSLLSLFSSSWATRSWTNIITLDWPTTRARVGWIKPAFHKRNSNLSFFFTVNLSLFLTIHFQWITISYVHLWIILFCFWPIKQKVSVLCRILIENELLLEFNSNSSKNSFRTKKSLSLGDFHLFIWLSARSAALSPLSTVITSSIATMVGIKLKPLLYTGIGY